jgi:hypothetical protein
VQDCTHLGARHGIGNLEWTHSKEVPLSKPVTPQDMFDMWQKMVNPGAYPLQSFMFPSLDPAEIEKKIAELNAVEHWLKANVNMIQLTVRTLQYQLALLKGGEKAQAVMAESVQEGKDARVEKKAAGAKAAQPQEEEAANPAMWAWNMMANAGKAGGGETPKAAKAAKSKPRGKKT